MEPFIGMISIFGFNFAPRGWSFCQGQLLSISQNTALFSLIGTTYGGDGRTTFALPNFNGRTAVGQGQAPGTSIHWTLGTMIGTDQHTMSLAEMPTHSHAAAFTSDGSSSVSVTLQASTGDGTSETPSAGSFLAKSVPGASPADAPEKIYSTTLDNPVALGGLTVSGSTGGGTVSVANAGNSNPFTLVQPSLGINYSIALTGIFPSRN